MEMAIIEGDEAVALITMLHGMMINGGVHTLRFAVEGGVKVKFNSGCWSPPIGRIADQGGY